MLRWIAQRWRTLDDVRREMRGLRQENARLTAAVRNLVDENAHTMMLVRALRDVNKDLDARLLAEAGRAQS